MEQLMIHTGSESYQVHLGEQAYSVFETDYKHLLDNADHIVIIADEQVAKLHLSILEHHLMKAGHSPKVLLVPAGESCKTGAVYLKCHEFLLEAGCSRKSLVIAFGGGACGDLAGFVAATFMRGIRYIHCPTTILAHDSAVGGKTAINLEKGKNMVGAFHQPSGVVFNTTLFSSLPQREIRSGMAELLKHALISDSEWTEELLNTSHFSSPPAEWLSPQLLRGIQVKADIVEQDVFEQSKRKYLNFGHTFGHAVEAVCGYGGLSHGESVVIGMAFSLVLSEAEGRIEEEFTNRYISFALQNRYPFSPLHEHSFETYMTYMMKDKKMSFGKLNFVLLEQVGMPFVKEVTKTACEEAFTKLKERLEAFI